MGIIDIKNLSFGYVSKQNILEKINLNIEEEKFTCIIGENGSGKSTLIKCILGLNKGYKGSIDIKEKVGYLPQRMNIQTDFPASVKEVVLSGTIANNPNAIFYSKKDKEKANKVMKELNIYNMRNKSFAELSGGQQQRVLISRALCTTDKIIILDEPTNGLDKNIGDQIYKLLEKLKKDLKLTIIMVSHDLDRIFKFADNVVELENGKIAYNGKISNYDKYYENYYDICDCDEDGGNK